MADARTPLTWDEIAADYWRITGRPAKILPMDKVFNWAMRQDCYEYDQEEDLLYRRVETAGTGGEMMGLDCEYPNACGCGCQDEPTHVGCKCCGREAEHAALAKAEAERDDVMRHVEKMMLRTEAAEARAEKAEAERDQLKQLHRHALNCVDQVFQPCGEIPNPVLPDFCELGEDKFQAVIRLARSYQAERARAEKTEAELEAVMHTVDKWFMDGVPNTNPATRAGEAREIALRAIEKAEEDARVARNETANEREMYEQMHDQVILFRRDSDKWAAEATKQTARAERVEAALSDAWRAFSQNVRDAGVTLAEAIWAGHRQFEDKERELAAIRERCKSMAEEINTLSARADRYLAAAGRLTDAMRTTGIVWKPEIWAAYQSLEKIVEEARNER